MNKRVIAFSLAMLLSLALAACGNQSSPTDSPVTDSPVTDTPTESPTPQPGSSSEVKTEAEIIADLTDSKEDFFGLFDVHCYDLDGNFDTDYTINSLTIDRRKSNADTGTDDVYVTVIAENPATRFTGEFHLLYELYDVGGWYLESIEMESEAYEPMDSLDDAQILFDLNTIFYDLGADESHYIVEGKTVDANTASVLAALDYNDGVISVSGPIYLTYYHDGTSWVKDDDYHDELSFDILAEGTYKFVPSYNGSTQYLVFNHENGEVVIRFASTNQSLGGFYDDFEILKNWDFDCASRSYKYQGPIGISSYRFTSEGTIDYYLDGDYIGEFTKIAEPITDINALAAHEWGNG